MPVAKGKASGSSSSKGKIVPNKADLEKLDELKQQMMRDAETLLLEKFPERITELNAMLKSPEFNLDLAACRSNLNIPRPDPAQPADNNSSINEPTAKRKRSESNSEPAAASSSSNAAATVAAGVAGTRVVLLPCGTVDVNKTIHRLLEAVKPYILQQVDDCNLIKMWIEFLIPKVEDGNNFGVDIQEECLKEVSTVESEAATYLDHGSRYHIARGKLVAKVAKYPHVEDFRKAVDEIDEKQFINVRLIVQELRNNYAGVHDMLTKNLEKIKRPRTTNAGASLY